MWSFVVSGLVYVFVAWWATRWLDGQGLERGMSRAILVNIIGALASWPVGWAIDKMAPSQAIGLGALSAAMDPSAAAALAAPGAPAAPGGSSAQGLPESPELKEMAAALAGAAK